MTPRQRVSANIMSTADELWMGTSHPGTRTSPQGQSQLNTLQHRQRRWSTVDPLG